jgi:hypothetical protein
MSILSQSDNRNSSSVFSEYSLIVMIICVIDLVLVDLKNLESIIETVMSRSTALITLPIRSE